MSEAVNMPDRYVIHAGRLYPGGGQPPLEDRAIEIVDGRIVSIEAAGNAPAADAVRQFEHIVTRLEAGATPPLFLCGGVGERLIPLVSSPLRERIATPQGDGLSGALRLAQALHETE